ncbi:MAG: AAA family ATPase [Chloroflexi bacterium]|nr:AAA family ATPase [Chloroflexota bacterium]
MNTETVLHASPATAQPASSIFLRVALAPPTDVCRGVVRIDPACFTQLGIAEGDVVRVAGRSVALARARPLDPEDVGHRRIRLDGLLRTNSGSGLWEAVQVSPAQCAEALVVNLYRIAAYQYLPHETDLAYLVEALAGLPVLDGHLVRLPSLGSRGPAFRVGETVPEGPVVITPETKLVIAGEVEGRVQGASYEDIGGLERELERIREMIELPLRRPDLFSRLGVLPPKGVLLYGPPGTGKTLLARAVASESQAHFIHVNGPEIMHKFYGQSEARLREIFTEAAKQAPSIIFFDEIDAIAPKRIEVTGEVEKRVVAQFLALLDGFTARGQVLVIGATNLPQMLDPALRRPGRFDREIEIGPPDRLGRLKILDIHTRSMPLDDDVDLAQLAERAHGFVGADLEALCQEAGMAALRRALEAGPVENPYGPAEAVGISRPDFEQAFRDVEPTAERELTAERTGIKLDDVAGLAMAKATLRSILDRSTVRADHARAMGVGLPRGILLTGASGSGKTLLARAAAGEIGAPLIAVEGPLLFSRWLGRSEKALAETFAKARRAAPCVLFFDDVDAVAPRRSAAAEYDLGAPQHRMVSQFLRELDNLADFPDVVLMAATSRVDLIDPALLRAGRFDYVLHLTAPDERDLVDLYRVHTRRMPVAPDVEVTRLAAISIGLYGADVEAVCRRAALLAIDEFTHGVHRPGRPTVQQRHFEQAIGQARRSTAD